MFSHTEHLATLGIKEGGFIMARDSTGEDKSCPCTVHTDQVARWMRLDHRKLADSV